MFVKTLIIRNINMSLSEYSSAVLARVQVLKPGTAALRLRLYLSLLPGILLLCSCASVRVNYDYDKTTDFSNYSTYGYYPEMETGLSQLDTRRLISAVDSVMRVKGFRMSEEPDFLINIHSASFHNPQENTVGVGVGGTGRTMGGGVSIGLPLGGTTIKREIVFDLVDQQKDVLFWQAVSTSDYRDNAAPSTREKMLHEVVRKVFSRYPPAP